MNVSEIVREMQSVSTGHLDCAKLAHLSKLTFQLIAAMPEAKAEYEQYRSVVHRPLGVDDEVLVETVNQKRILVTGGTGCIGSHLVQRLVDLGAAEVVSLSRGVTQAWPSVDGVRYESCDVRDRERVAALVDAFRPESVYHLAAQRSPELAEKEVQQTISTNVGGTKNILEACVTSGVEQFAHASTGKAMRMYSSDVYAASKRLAEWMVVRAANKGRMRCAAARFTHVVDNAILLSKLHESLEDGVMRLHDPDIGFYVQSAEESADLLVAAGASAQESHLTTCAIRDLGWPVSLLALALGFYQEQGRVVPVVFQGQARGYESVKARSIYDPQLSGSVSPLLNGFEAASVKHTVFAPLDAFVSPFRFSSDDERVVEALLEACGQSVMRSVQTLELASRHVLDAALQAVDPEQLHRIVKSFSYGSGERLPYIDQRAVYWDSVFSTGWRG